MATAQLHGDGAALGADLSEVQVGGQARESVFVGVVAVCSEVLEPLRNEGRKRGCSSISTRHNARYFPHTAIHFQGGNDLVPVDGLWQLRRRAVSRHVRELG
jgi:hypothetical protein